MNCFKVVIPLMAYHVSSLYPMQQPPAPLRSSLHQADSGSFTALSTQEATVPAPSSLHEAAASNNIASVIKCLAAGANPYEKGLLGATPIHSAATSDNWEVVCILLQRFPDLINVQDDFGETVAHTAVIQCRNLGKILPHLDNFNCDLRDIQGNTILHHAVTRIKKQHQSTLIQYFLKQDPSLIKAKNNRGDTPAHTLLKFKNILPALEVIKLLDYFDDQCWNEQNDRGDTPLHCFLRALIASKINIYDSEKVSSLLRYLVPQTRDTVNHDNQTIQSYIAELKGLMPQIAL